MYHQMNAPQSRQSDSASGRRETTEGSGERDLNAHSHTFTPLSGEPPPQVGGNTENHIEPVANDAPHLRRDMNSPKTRSSSSEHTSVEAKSLGSPRMYTTVNTSLKNESIRVFRLPDRAIPTILSEIESPSEHRDASDTSRCATHVEEDYFEYTDDRVTREDEADDDIGAAVLGFHKVKRPRRPEGVLGKESPLPPSVLRMRLSSGRISAGGNGTPHVSPDKAGGRYSTLSLSSRQEDSRRLLMREMDIAQGGNVCFEKTRAVIQDDMVRNSPMDSFSVDGDGVTSALSAQPQRMNSSMNSLVFLKSRKPLNMNASFRLGSHCNSPSSSANSPRSNADAMTPTSMRLSGPHFRSSNQSGIVSHCRSQHQHVHTSYQQTHQSCHGDKELTGDNGRRVGGTMRSKAPGRSLPSGSDVSEASLSLSNGFDLVRAPIAGLRAVLLGNNAVEEEEVAEDPEMRVLQIQQLKNFYAKVVSQHRDGPKTSAPVHSSSTATFMNKPLVASEAPRTPSPNATADATTDGVAYRQELGILALPSSSDIRTDCRAVLSTENVLARGIKKREKRVMFNMKDVVQWCAEDNGAAPLCHHGTPRGPHLVTQLASSALELQCSSAETNVGSDAVDVVDSPTWRSPPSPAWLRMNLNASNMSSQWMPASSTEKARMLTDTAAQVEAPVLFPMSLARPLRRTPRPSSSGSPRSAGEDRLYPRTTPFTSLTSVNSALPLSPPPTAVAAIMPSPPPLPSKTLEQLHSISGAEERCRFCGIDKRDESKGHYEAPMVVTKKTANDTVALQSGFSFEPQTLLSHSWSNSLNVEKTSEVSLRDHKTTRECRAKSHDPLQTSKGDLCVPAKDSPCKQSEESIAPLSHCEVSVLSATKALRTPSSRIAQLARDDCLSSVPPLQLPFLISAPLCVTLNFEASAAKQQTRKKSVDENQCNTQRSSESVYSAVNPPSMNTELPLRIGQTPSRSLAADAPGEWVFMERCSPLDGKGLSKKLRPTWKGCFSVEEETVTTLKDVSSTACDGSSSPVQSITASVNTKSLLRGSDVTS